MLERLRNDRRLALWVLLCFALVLAVALVSGAQTRRQLQAVQPLAAAADPAAAHAHHGHGHAHTLDAAAPAPEPHHAHRGHEADPACVLCLALSTPPAVRVSVYRPPSAHMGRLWLTPEPPTARRDTAPPPPPRGPPA